MNYKYLSALTILIFPLLSCGMNTTFFKPATTTPKIRFATDNFFTINSLYAHNTAISSYSKNGKKTYLLSWTGPENLLNSYVDASLQSSDTTSAGKAYIDAKSITNEFGLIITKNISRGFFFETQLYIKQLRLKNIHLVPLNSENEPFASKEKIVSENPTFAQYLNDFESLYFIPSISPKGSTTKGFMQNYSFVNSFLFAGYAQTWNHFSRIDFIDFTGKIGLDLEFTNKQNKSFIIQLPLHANNGFCAELNTAIGIFNWMNIGANVSTKIFTTTEQTIGLNTNSVDNDFLKPYINQASVKPGLFFYGNIYIEADHFANGFSILFGYTHTRQQKTKIETSLNSNMSQNFNNEQNRYQGWSLGTLLYEVEYDFATEKCKNVPTLKFSIFQSIHGKKVFKSITQATSCCLQFSHKF